MKQEILQSDFKTVIELIQKSRYKALRQVNKELIDLYWQVGAFVSEKVESDGWGKSSVQQLSDYIIENEPNIKGFSSQNIWRMRQVYDTYKDYPNLSTLLREISWSANLHIVSKTKSLEEKEFYLRLAINESYSVRELERQIDSGYYERSIISAPKQENKKLSTVLREIHPAAETIFKDKYVFDFVNLPETYSEKDLQKAFVSNLKNFILEIGKDFTFVGQEYRLQVGKHDYLIDLLFFHRELCCLVAFELKIDEFKPDYLGQLNFYLEALDRDVKKEHEKPSVGVLLCKTKDDEVVEYALSRSLSPAMVAEYETKLIDKQLLRTKLLEFYEAKFED
jgi:predicted nuclease of restriction endonuclease-like (RecB) superfamily